MVNGLQTRHGIFMGAPYDGARFEIYGETETSFCIGDLIYNHDKKKWQRGVKASEWWNKGHISLIEVKDAT